MPCSRAADGPYLRMRVVYVSTEAQLPAPASPVVVTSVSRGRFLLSESPACDVSGLDVQCPPFTVQLQQLYIDNMLGMLCYRS